MEELVASVGPPIENAQRYEEARRLADMDPVTGLQNERYFDERLAREVSRARRYERQLALLLFRLEVTDGGTSLLTTVGRRVLSAVRSADVSCYLGNGRFAIILPEVGVREAEHLDRRLQFALGPRIEQGGSKLDLVSGLLELLPEDNAETFMRRAQETLRQAEQSRGAARRARKQQLRPALLLDGRRPTVGEPDNRRTIGRRRLLPLDHLLEPSEPPIYIPPTRGR